MESIKRLKLIVHGLPYPTHSDLAFCINVLLNEKVTDEEKKLVKNVLYRYKISNPDTD